LILTVAAIVTLAALVYTLLVRSKDIPEPLPVSPVAHLEDRKQAIYDNLRDLQFEYRLGKLSDADYSQTKQALQRELAGVLKQMEEVAGSAPARKDILTPEPKVLTGTLCPHCGARFAEALRFCGECGKAMS
jgi:hypothetical protein